ncbi:MAG: metalloregulator ArsR/SmtB family transcription factor [Tetrasphaera sp.]
MTYESAAAFDCLGSPTRRALLELLRDRELSVRELTDALPISQPAVSQHLKALRGAGLVTSRDHGAARLYRVDLAGMTQVRAWVDSFWDDVLAAFVAHVETADGRVARAADHAHPNHPTDATGDIP